MKNVTLSILALCFMVALSSCNLIKRGQGCPSNGKNVGAEKILDGSKAPKAKKFKA